MAHTYRIKTALCSVLLGFGVVTSSAVFAAGIPTFDAIQESLNLQQLTEMQNQLAEARSQLAEQQKMVQTLTSSLNTSGLTDVLGNNKYRDYLPTGWADTYKAIQKGDFSALSDSAKDVYNQNLVFDACTNMSPDTKKLCQAKAYKSAQDQAFLQDSYDKSKARIENLDKLSAKIATTDAKDVKAISDLQAAISAENGRISNEKMKMDQFAQITKAQDDAMKQQRNELMEKKLKSQKNIVVAPLTFD